MKTWKKNIRALRKINEEMADDLQQVIEKGPGEKIQAKQLENGETVLAIEKDGHLWHLNSRLDPEGAARIFAERYPKKPFFRYFLFGMSDGRAIRALLAQCDKQNVIFVCEPDKEIMAEAFRQFDFKDLLTDGRVCFLLSEMKQEIAGIVTALVEYSYRKLVDVCILPGYDVLYTKECREFMDEVVDKLHNDMLNRNTYLAFDRTIPCNLLFHMCNMISQRNVEQIKQELERKNSKGVPALLIAAGPSLDKNIKEAKRAQGKAFIVVVDAAVRTVLKAGIRPDLVFTVDPRAPKRFYENPDGTEIFWCCLSHSNREIFSDGHEKIFYYNPFVAWWDRQVRDELGYGLSGTETGQCVSAEAFLVLRNLGFETIILIGQDLAFTGGQSHTNSIRDVLGDNDEYISKRHLLEVKDADGNLLTTDYQMNCYREWFEKQIRLGEGKFRVINATEGGAKMEGAEICTLKEAIDAECKRKFDMQPVMRKIPPMFDIEAQKRMMKKIDEIQDIKQNFIRQLKKGTAMSRALAQEADRLSGAELKKRLKAVIRQSAKIEKEPFFSFATMYALDSEYEFKDNIYAKEEMPIAEMMERGIKLLASYERAIPLFEEDLQAALIRLPQGL